MTNEIQQQQQQQIIIIIISGTHKQSKEFWEELTKPTSMLHFGAI
jgi:hypothetical protein